jgi:streptogramin lyase
VILQKLKLRVGMLLLGVVSLGASSFAASYPLNFPYGLAVDSHGNLYVANMNGNQVLVYDLDHVQVPAKTITNNVNGPTGVAFDLNGDLWITNSANSTVTAFMPNGDLYASFYGGVSNPQAIAIDGLNDVIINNSFQNLSLYPQDPIERYFSPLYTYTSPNTNFTGLASSKGVVAVGTNTEAFLFALSPALQNQMSQVLINATCFAAAFDGAGNLYCGNQNGTLTMTPVNEATVKLAALGFFPVGIAIDNAHGLIYISGGTANKIAVYNMKGVLLTTIE